MTENFNDWLTSRPIAHRGLHNHTQQIPENSLPAFAIAAERGYAIELDVQLLLDKEVAVFHDERLKRMCRKDVLLSAVSSTDLHRYPLLDTPERIPLLREVLMLVNGRVPLFIEIKRQPKVSHANMIILNTLLAYKGPYAIMSFDPFILAWFAKNAPLIPRGQLSSDFKDIPMPGYAKFLLKRFAFNFLSRPDFIGYIEDDIPNKTVQRQRKKGKPVIAWTVSTVQKRERLTGHIDNYIFEHFEPETRIAG